MLVRSGCFFTPRMLAGETERQAMSICLSSMSFCSFSNSAPAPDGGVGGRSDPAVPPNKADRT